MMMNFKKNQNNAVCSMDCKNCPNGASVTSKTPVRMIVTNIKCVFFHLRDPFD